MAKKDELENNVGGTSEKLKALQAAMDKIEKNFGKGAVIRRKNFMRNLAAARRKGAHEDNPLERVR